MIKNVKIVIAFKSKFYQYFVFTKKVLHRLVSFCISLIFMYCLFVMVTLENEAIKHDLVEFKVQCLKIFCYHGNKSTILLFYSIFRTTPEVSSKLYFVEIC